MNIDCRFYLFESLILNFFLKDICNVNLGRNIYLLLGIFVLYDLNVGESFCW